MALAQDLLEQAYFLATRERNRPKQASLRRAVSTAYYALFHLLVSEAVLNWRIQRQRSSLARVYEHRKIKQVCLHTRTTNRDLQLVSKCFLELQQARYDADYNYGITFTRTEVQAHISGVKTAFAAWKRIKHLRDSEDFLFAMIAVDRR